jgi:hypothetical protein
MSGLALALRFTTLLTAASAVILTIGAPAQGDTILINNGSSNVIDDPTTHQNNSLIVRNVGCPPGGGSPTDPCPSPGDPTEVVIVEGGWVETLGVYDTSTITMTGGTLESTMVAHDSSTIAVSGGALLDDLIATDFSTLTMSGGTVGRYLAAHYSSTVTLTGGAVSDSLRARHTSTFTIVGSGFAVDGISVPFGNLTTLTGTLTGTLASGDSLNSVFYQGGYNGPEGSYTGIIRLVPEPSTALLLALGLAWLGVRPGLRTG